MLVRGFHRFQWLITLVAGFALCAGIALAQTETGQITIKATDPNAAVISGASVTVRSVDTGLERTATTNEEGIAVVTNLQPGLYEVTVNAQGFATRTQRAQVTVGARVSVEAQLALPGVTGEVVEVVASGGVEVNTQNQELSNVVSGTQVRELPSLTRNPYDFVQLSGNVSPADPSGRGAGFSINGQRAASTNILLDGSDNNNVFSATVGQSVPLDSVQEFRVLTSNFSAEYGRASGGIVNVATRAGTNDFHGSAYEFYRGAALSGNSYENNAQGLPKGNFVRNQFGYSLGGPVMRDKLFFFSSTEWIRVRSSNTVTNFVPTSQLLAASAGATQQFFSGFQLATPINGRILTVGDVTRILNLPAGTAFTRLPAATPAFGEVRYRVPANAGGGLPQNTYQTVARVDWNATDKTQLYVRYALEDVNIFPGTNSFSPYQGFSTGNTDFNNNALISATHTFSPNFISQTKLVFNRLNNLQPLGERPAGPTLYFFGNTVAQLQGFNIALPGYLPFSPGSAIPFGGPQNLLQVYEDLNTNVRNHQFRYGGSYIYIRDNRTFGAFQNAVETLGTNFSQGLSNFVTGNLLQFQAAINPQGRFPGQTISLPVGPPNFSRSNRFHEFALYVNDSWRARPRLTVNLGLRYEFFGTPHNKDPRLDSNFYFGQGADLFNQIRNGSVQIAQNSPIGQLWQNDKNNFGPRVGFAWDVFGNGKTSVRGGYGISYERNFNNVTFNIIQNPPNYAVISLTAPTDIASLPITTSNAGPLAGSGLTRVLPAVSLRAVDPKIKTAYAHFWSLALEREVFPNTVGSLQYSGSAGRDLYTISNVNRAGGGPVLLGSRATTPTGGTSSRLNGQYSNINFRTNGGRSNYNALIAELRNSRFRDLGLSFTASYTFSKALDNLSSTFSESGNNFNLGLLDPFNPNLDYGYADFDVRHRFVSSFNWEVPYFRNLSGPANLALAGWELTGIFNAQSGSPFTVFDCTNGVSVCPRALLTGAVKRSGVGGSRPVTDEPNRFNYLDLTGLAGGAGTYINTTAGNADFGPYPRNMSARNFFRGPGAWDMDAGLYKRFHVTERFGLQFRAEFYNLFNHPNLFIRGGEADISSSTYVPAFKSGRRNIQLALKLTF